MSTEIVPTAHQRLPEIAAAAQIEHEAVHRSLSESLQHAIKLGDLLLEARTAFPGRGDGFVEWVETVAEIPYNTAAASMRIAHYQDILPDGINMQEAKEFIVGLPALTGRNDAVLASYPASLREEAKRQFKQGRSLTEIAGSLEVSLTTVWRWCNDKKTRRYAQDALRRRRMLEKMELRDQRRREAERVAKARGGSASRSYSYLRRLAQELDRAIATEHDKTARARLKEALADVYRAEVQISAALGVQHGSWEELQ